MADRAVGARTAHITACLPMTQPLTATAPLALHFPCIDQAPGPAQSVALADIQARDVQPGDSRFLQALYASTRVQEMEAVGWSGEVRANFLADQFRLQHQHYQAHFPQAQFLLLLRCGTPIGRLYWQCGPAVRATLIDICLLPAERGAGLGSGVLELLIAQADALRQPIHLHVERFNPARRWYARFGFQADTAQASGTSGVYVSMSRPARSRECAGAAP
jgi:GNAT superfamily N-acetyltransferase